MAINIFNWLVRIPDIQLYLRLKKNGKIESLEDIGKMLKMDNDTEYFQRLFKRERNKTRKYLLEHISLDQIRCNFC